MFQNPFGLWLENVFKKKNVRDLKNMKFNVIN